MIDFVNEGAEPETVAQQDELVLVLRALPTDSRQELDRLGPLGVGELRLAGKRVEVGDERGDELERAGVLTEALVELLNAVSYHVHGDGSGEQAASTNRDGHRTHWSVMG